MAQKVNIVLVDDLDGSEATQTVTFGIDGASYEIDLNDEHADQFRDAVAPYVAAARRAGTGAAFPRHRGARPAGAAAPGSGSRSQQIRDWARQHGHQVSDRGRVPAAVVRAYETANS